MQNASLSTDMITAFVEMARQGNMRRAAEQLFITEQGVRQRLIALEQVLGVELYRKSRGRRANTPLTAQGQQFLPQAIAFLQQANQMVEYFHAPNGQREIHVVASQYLIAYVLIEAVRRFQAKFPRIQVCLSARSEAEIETSLLTDTHIAFGMAAPYEASPLLEYCHLFSMDWSVIASPRHIVLKQSLPKLAQLVSHRLILYERGSTGRQHVLEAFQQQRLPIDTTLEATNTDIIVRMVEAGLGIAIVPLLHSGVVTRSRRVQARSLGKQIRPIHSGLLVRKNEQPTTEAKTLMEFIQAYCQEQCSR
jgi:DNA-binding transcriptional LysR family regulator